MNGWVFLASFIAVAFGAWGAYRYFGSLKFLTDFITYVIPEVLKAISKRASPEEEKKFQEAARRNEDHSSLAAQDPKRKKSLFGKKTGIFK